MVQKKRKVKGIVKKKVGLRLKNRDIWIYFTIVLLLSVLTILSLFDDFDVTGHAVQTISFMRGGQGLHFEVSDIPGVKEVNIQLSEDVKNGKIIFNVDDGISFERNFYSKFIVSSLEEEKYEFLSFLLKIEESKLLEKGINKADICLFVNGQKLATTFVESKDSYLFYTATSTEMGQFVIGQAAPVETIVGVVREDVKEMVGFEEEKELGGEELPLVGKAEEQQFEEEGFFARISNFFKELFD